MIKKLNIILIILAYGLNFAHDVQLHVHHAPDLFCNSHKQTIQHFHDILTECQHNDDESHKLPIQHCHLEHAHENVILRNVQNYISNSDFAKPVHSNYCFLNSENREFNYFQPQNDLYYKTIDCLSFSLRAPPDFS
jgi:hypothetical protein